MCKRQQEFYRRGNATVQWTKITYFTDNKANSKNHVTLRVTLSFHTIGLVILNFDEDTEKKGNAYLLLVRG